MPTTLTVTAKGQVTLRRAVLDHLGVRPGQKLQVSTLSDGRVELCASTSTPSLSALRGRLRHPSQRVVSLAEMQEAIEREAAGE